MRGFPKRLRRAGKVETTHFRPCSHGGVLTSVALRGTRRGGGATPQSNARIRRFDQHSDRHAPGITKSAICVQRFDDSLNSAIHTTYRSWLRSSSMHEPRDPPLKVIILSHITFSFSVRRRRFCFFF